MEIIREHYCVVFIFCVRGCYKFLRISVFVHASAKQVSGCHAGAGPSHVYESWARLLFNMPSSGHFSHYLNFFFFLIRKLRG